MARDCVRAAREAKAAEESVGCVRAIGAIDGGDRGPSSVTDGACVAPVRRTSERQKPAWRGRGVLSVEVSERSSCDEDRNELHVSTTIPIFGQSSAWGTFTRVTEYETVKTDAQRSANGERKRNGLCRARTRTPAMVLVNDSPNASRDVMRRTARRREARRQHDNVGERHAGETPCTDRTLARASARVFGRGRGEERTHHTIREDAMWIGTERHFRHSDRRCGGDLPETAVRFEHVRSGRCLIVLRL